MARIMEPRILLRCPWQDTKSFPSTRGYVADRRILEPSYRFEGCLTVHLSHEIKWNANLMQLGNFIDVFLARHVSGAYVHNLEYWMLSYSIWFSAPSFWIGGGLESRCVGRVYGADVATRHHPHRTHDLRSSSQDHHPSKNTVQKTICCNSTSNAPDDRRMYPKHVELRMHQ